jgi:hypothetical protein
MWLAARTGYTATGKRAFRSAPFRVRLMAVTALPLPPNVAPATPEQQDAAMRDKCKQNEVQAREHCYQVGQMMEL